MRYLLNWKYWVLFLFVLISSKVGLKQLSMGNGAAMLMLDSMSMLCFVSIVHIAYHEGRKSRDQDPK
jgi:amino acid permease